MSHTNLSYQQQKIRCLRCHWEGLGSECKIGRIYEEMYEIRCPGCHETIGSVAYQSYNKKECSPYLADCQHNSLEDYKIWKSWYYNGRLESPAQLPEIDAEVIILNWDLEGTTDKPYAVIKHQNREIWREPTSFENYDHFMHLGDFLKEKYGDRLWDIVPMPGTEYYLWGDRLSAPSAIDDYRERLHRSCRVHPNVRS